MTYLTQATPRAYELGEHNDYPVNINTLIYEGAALSDSGQGYVQPLLVTRPFFGFALQTVDNRQGLPGAQRVRVRMRGIIKLKVLGQVALTDVGKGVYALDDNTFTLEKDGHTYIGRIVRLEEDEALVAFDAARGSLGRLPELLDQSGGTVSETHTLYAISANYSQSELANTIATLAAKVNALLRQTG